MTAIGELVLVVGDMHIPHRAATIPEKFKKMLVPNKMQHVLSTGNLCTKQEMEYLRHIAPSVHVVRGDMDENADHLPEQAVVSLGNFRIGLCHGHQVVPWGDQESLGILARQLDVDILITGHTHQSATYKLEEDGPLFLNPGSITGAPSLFSEEEIKPSFICMSVLQSKVFIFCYVLENGEVKIKKTEYSKPERKADI